MDHYYTLNLALEYIETHIFENPSQAEIASASCLSLSSLQKLFRYTFGFSVNEYITKRKMTLAGEELLASSISISELAVKYGYTSTEAFGRAFSKVNCCLPSEYRKQKGAQAIFTPLKYTEKGVTRDTPRLLEAMRAAVDCFVVCFDVAGMNQINKISHEAGDLALMEAVRRIRTHGAEEMKMFRIGRSEFAVITPFTATEDVERFSAAVLACNEKTFSYKGQEIPLYLRSWYGKNTPFTNIENPAITLKWNVKYLGTAKEDC